MTSWSSQPLPSGSLNDAYVKYERRSGPGPGNPRAAVEQLADLDAAADEVLTRRLDVATTSSKR